ncbi:unnamed protein product, partial [Porites lobata]
MCLYFYHATNTTAVMNFVERVNQKKTDFARKKSRCGWTTCPAWQSIGKLVRKKLPNQELKKHNKSSTASAKKQMMEVKPIACDNPSCKFEWFHFQCVGLQEEEDFVGEWFCPSCTLAP